MSRSSSQTGARFLAGDRCESHRSTQNRRPKSGPAAKGSPPSSHAPEGYTSEKSGTVVVVRRNDIGAAPAPNRSSAHHEPGVVIPTKFPAPKAANSSPADTGMASNNGHYRNGRSGRCSGKRASG